MKRVCILSRNRLYREGIATLLAQEKGIEIVGPEGETEIVDECIEECRPDVVIVDYGDTGLELAPVVLCMLKKQLGICVIGLSLRDNRLVICRGEQKEVAELGDLLETIRA